MNKRPSTTISDLGELKLLRSHNHTQGAAISHQRDAKILHISLAHNSAVSHHESWSPYPDGSPSLTGTGENERQSML